MKKHNYKKVEEVEIFFNKKIWKALHNATERFFDESHDTLVLKDGKIYAVYCYWHSLSEYNEEMDAWVSTLPNRVWKPLLISFGFIPKNLKTYRGGYKAF